MTKTLSPWLNLLIAAAFVSLPFLLVLAILATLASP